jgi:WD40 repeat protein
LFRALNFRSDSSKCIGLSNSEELEERHMFRLVAVLTLLATLAFSALAADPPRDPFLRIETGMHSARIMCIDVDAAERYLVTGSDDKTARVWDFASGKLLRILRLPQGPDQEGRIYAVALSPDGQTVAVGGWTGYAWDKTHSIYLFERASGRLVRRLTGLPSVINHLHYSPDGGMLVAALGGSNGMRVYRTDTWTEIARDTEYGVRSTWAEFDRSGQRIVTASYDGLVRLYERAGETYRLTSCCLAVYLTFHRQVNRGVDHRELG